MIWGLAYFHLMTMKENGKNESRLNVKTNKRTNHTYILCTQSTNMCNIEVNPYDATISDTMGSNIQGGSNGGQSVGT